MSWMPKAERVAQLGESVRCNKTVSKVALPRLRTSSQVNYPESAARPHITGTFGGEALPSIRRKNQWDTTPGEERRRQLQLRPDQILDGIVDSFDGTYSGLYSDWQRTNPNARKSLRAIQKERAKERSSSKRQSPPKRRSPTKRRGVHINDTHENRHNRAHTRREAETRRLSEERVRRERTGMLISTESHAVVKKSLLTKLQEESQFGAQELRNVMSSFQKHADPAKYSLSRDAFSEVVKELFDNITPKLCAELFDAMDVDGSGTVDYGELVTGCAKVVHDLSTEDRFKMIFEAYDRDGSGMIDTTDLMRIAEEKGEQLSQSMDLVHNMIVSLDTHGKGYIDFSDFMTAVESTPILVDAFECLLPSPALLKKHVPALEKATGSKFDWARLNDLVTFIRTCGGGTAGRDDAEKITRAGFRSMMEDFFGFHDEEVTGLFFDAMDSDDSGIISFKELMQGLSTALRSTPQQRAEFFFKMYDDAGTGTVGRFQLQSLLGRGQHALNKLNGEASKSGNYKQHGAGAQQQLEAHGMMMDTGGDGRVSHAEFVAAINQNPQLLHLFDCCVH